MQLVVNPVADQQFFASLRASNMLIARKRRRVVTRFLAHAAGVCAVMVMAVGYLNNAAARSPGLANEVKPVVAATMAAPSASADRATRVGLY